MWSLSKKLNIIYPSCKSFLSRSMGHICNYKQFSWTNRNSLFHKLYLKANSCFLSPSWSKMAAILIWFGSPDIALGTYSKAKKPANNTRFCKFFIVIYLSLDIFGLNFLLQKQIFGIFSTLKLLPRWLSNAWHP